MMIILIKLFLNSKLDLEGVSQNLRMINGNFKTTFGYSLANYMNIFHTCLIQTCLAPKNERLNLSFVKDIHVVGKVNDQKWS